MISTEPICANPDCRAPLGRTDLAWGRCARCGTLLSRDLVRSLYDGISTPPPPTADAKVTAPPAAPPSAPAAPTGTAASPTLSPPNNGPGWSDEILTGMVTRPEGVHVGGGRHGRPRTLTGPQAKTRMFGKYHIERKLSESSTAKVYRAVDTVLRRVVALKVLQLTDPASIKRFRREAQTAARIDHPNFCQIYEIGEHQGIHFLALEYLEGKTLASLLENNPRPFSLRESLALVRRLALAMAVAHERDVIHRDLKPANIMIDPLGAPIIIDFGMAKVFDLNLTQLTKFGTPFGTPCYMPPEQVYGDLNAIGPAVDIYALGVILFELLAGRRPYVGESQFAIFAQITSDAPPPLLTTYRPGLDPRIEAICRRAMAKPIASRYGSMIELASDLDDLLRSFETEEAARVADPAWIVPDPIKPKSRPFVEPKDNRPVTRTVSPSGEGDYTSLLHALRQVPERSRLYLRPGQYRERPILDKPVELVGDGPTGSVSLAGVVLDSDHVTLRRLHFRASTGLEESRPGGVVEVRKGQVRIEECLIEGGGKRVGLLVRGPEANPVVTSCRIEGRDQVGVLVHLHGRGLFEEVEIHGGRLAGIVVGEGAAPTFRRCVVSDHGGPGLFVRADGAGLFEECQFHGNAKAQVMLGDDASPTIVRCGIGPGPDSGVFAHGRARGLIEECTVADLEKIGLVIIEQANPHLVRSAILRCREGGVVATHAAGLLEDCEIAHHCGPNLKIKRDATTRIVGCRIYSSGDCGVSLSARTQAVLEDCELFEHTGPGVMIWRSANPQLLRCRIHHNASAGVRVFDHAQGQLEHCSIDANQGPGLDLDYHANPLVRSCRIHGNAEHAVLIRNHSSGRFEKNDLTGNRGSLLGRLFGFRRSRGVWKIGRGCHPQLEGNLE